MTSEFWGLVRMCEFLPGRNLRYPHENRAVMVWWYTCRNVTWFCFFLRTKKTCSRWSLFMPLQNSHFPPWFMRKFDYNRKGTCKAHNIRYIYYTQYLASLLRFDSWIYSGAPFNLQMSWLLHESYIFRY